MIRTRSLGIALAASDFGIGGARLRRVDRPGGPSYNEDYTDTVNRRLSSGLTIFGYFTAVGLLFFGYRYLEHVATRDSVSPLDPLTNEYTGTGEAAPRR